MSKLEIITEPTVAIVGHSAIDDAAMAEWLESCGVKDWTSDAPSDGEKLVEFGARACYHSFSRPRPGGNAAMVANLLKQGHGSCLEHAVFTVAIAGVSRSLTHELIRHRHLSPSQLSQRFYDESDARFVLPPILIPRYHAYQAGGPGGELYDQWQSACLKSLEAYQDLATGIEIDLLVELWQAAGSPDQDGTSMDAEESDHAQIWAESHLSRPNKTLIRKRAREAARSVLTNSTETRIILTGNARAYRGAIEQRGTIHADLEIRRLAVAILRKLQTHAPHLFADGEIYTDADGRESVRFTHRKV